MTSDPHLNAPLPGSPSNMAVTAAPKARRSFRRNCPECGVLFETTTHDRMFCTTEHKAAFHNRSNTLGRVIIPLAQAWREGRNVKGKTPEARARRASANRAFHEVCRLLDAAAAEDRETHRMPKLTYVRRRWASEGDLRAEETTRGQEEIDARAERAAQAEARAAAKAAAVTA